MCSSVWDTCCVTCLSLYVCPGLTACRTGSSHMHRPCGLCKDVGHSVEGACGMRWRVWVDTQLFPEHLCVGAGVSLKEGCSFGACRAMREGGLGGRQVRRLLMTAQGGLGWTS